MPNKKKNNFINRLKKTSAGVFSLGVLLFFVFSVPVFAAWYIFGIVEEFGREIPVIYPIMTALILSLFTCAITISLRLAIAAGEKSPNLVVGRLARRIGPILLLILMAGSYFMFNQKADPAIAGWWNDAWSYRKAITINHAQVVADQVNFPVLVSFTDANLINHAQTDGDDFIFISSEGQKLSHEIEKYTSGTGELISWVKIPALSAVNDTVLYLYYGNPTAGSQQDKVNVWDNNFAGVWHLKERPDNNDGCGSNLACDSTQNSYSGTYETNMIAGDQITGQIDGSIDLDGADNYVTHGDVLDFNLTDQFTVSAWIKPSVVPGAGVGRYIFSKQDNDSPWPGWGFQFVDGSAGAASLYLSYVDSSGNITHGTSNTRYVTTGNWQYVVGTYNNESISLYHNGVSATTSTATAAAGSSNTSVPFCIGCDDNAKDELFPGLMDEVRVSRSIRSTSWIQTEYNNQSSTSTFYAIQAEEVGPGPIVYLSFDEGYGTTVNDESGHGYAGTLSAGTSSPWQASDMCLSGKCLYFDGYNDYVRVSSGMITAYPFTLNAWVKAIGPANDGVVMSLQDKDAANIMYGLYVDSSPQGAVQARARNTTSYDNYGQKYISDNKWHYLSGIFNTATDRQVYIDGELQTIGSITSATYNTAVDSLDIGRWGSSTPSNYFTGFIDEVKIYPYARSANEIRADYAAGLAGQKTEHGVAASFGDASDKWLTDGLVGYWKMDESATTSGAFDASGNGNNGTYYSPASTTAGKYGRGSVFDGDTGYIDVGGGSSLDITGEEITISAWINFPPLGSGDTPGILNKGGYNNGYRIGVWYRGVSDYSFWFQATGVTYTLDSAASLTANEWHHVVAMLSGGKMSVYVDGQKDIAELDRPGNIAHTDNPLWIGQADYNCIGESWCYPYKGKVDEVRIYNRALSPDEVRKLYEWAPPPVAHWRFDEHLGTTAYDSAASTTFSGGNHGTLGDGTAANRPVWDRGRYGGALEFDGSNDRINMGDPSDGRLDFGLNSFTFMSWAKVHSNTGSWQKIIHKGAGVSSNPGWDLLIMNDASSVYAGVSDGGGGGGDLVTSNYAPISLNTWFHAAIVVERPANLLHIFFNGIEYGAADDISAIGSVNATDPFFVGLSSGGSYPFDGEIDDIRVYNYARTQKQIIEDMNAGHPAGGSPVGSELVYWSFDEGYGTTVYDSTIHAKTLTLSSATGWTLDGKFNRAYQGADNRRAADGADDDDLDFTATEDFALSAWVRYTTANPANTEYILHKQIGNEGYGLMMNGLGRLSFGIGDTLSSVFPEDYASSTIDHADNLWHHVLGRKTSNSKIELYIDGKLDAADTSLAANGTLENTATLYIGDANGTDGTDEFLGAIDEVKIYPYALTDEEIKMDYNRNSSQILGSLGTASAATSSNAQSLAYCVPGSTDYCAPPVGEWRFDEKSGTTTYDLSGNANNGVFVSAASSPVWKGSGKCKTGSCLEFDGNGDYVRVTDSASLRLTSAMTISLWMKADSYSQNDSWIDSEGHYILRLNFSGDGLELLWWDGSNVRYTSQAAGGNIPLPSTGAWHHLEWVVSGNDTAAVYIDGISKAITTGVDYAAGRYNSNLIIGRHQTVDAQCFDGLIDEVRIYNYARTPAQIAWDFNRGKPIAHWRFDECAGGTIFDSAVAWNGGTSSNGVLQLGSSGTTATGTCASSSNSFWYNGRNGRSNSAGSFDGTDDYVKITDNNSLDFTGDFSLSAWIYPDSFGDNVYGRIFNNQSSSGGFGAGYSLYLGNNPVGDPPGTQTVCVNIGDAVINCPDGCANDNSITLGTWQLVSIVFKDSLDTVYFYINGKPQGAKSVFSEALAVNSTDETIGDRDDLIRSFDGLIDEVKIFNYALTPLQVQTEYAGGAVRFGQ